MPFFEWSERMSVGVAELDSDHQALIQLINRLHDALNHDEGRSALDQIFESLAVYIETHFAREELVMEACGYPEISEHKQQHLNFTQNTHYVRDRYFRGEDAEVGHDLLNQLKDWWNHHILLLDMGYKTYVEDNDLVDQLVQTFGPGLSEGDGRG